MLTYEDMTGLFLKAAVGLDLTTHPEYWLNTRNLEREFACTCHTGSCEDMEERQSTCTVSFTWGSLDTALSLDGPRGICEFFHDNDEHEDCHHLRTHAIPPLVVDLSYSLALNGAPVSEDALLSLVQMLKLQASEHSRRTTETQPGIAMVLFGNRLLPATLNLQQRVEIPIWHPQGLYGLHDDTHNPSTLEDRSGIVDEPHPEEWLPRVMIDVCQDIVQVLDALNTAVSSYHASDL